MARSTNVLWLSAGLLAACMGDVGEASTDALATTSQEATTSNSSADEGTTRDAYDSASTTVDEGAPSLAYAVLGCPATTATNAQHVTAGRATAKTTSFFFFRTTTYSALGTNENLGTSGTAQNTLYQIATASYSKSASRCPAAPSDAGVADAGSGGAVDAGPDAGGATDAGIRDAGNTPLDAGAPTRDAGTAPADAGTAPVDAGSATQAPRALPTPKEACPTLAEGVVSVLGRKVTLWMGNDGTSKLGPVVIYWHATGSSPSEVMSGLGSAAVQEIKNQGGMVIAMNAYDGASSGGTTTGNNVWYTGDFGVTDEVLACAIATGVGVDTARIHTLGFSAGALQASYMVNARSNYLASATSYSGGSAFSVSSNDATNKLPVIFFHGGANDTVGINFQQASTTMANQLKSAGHFVVMCNHGGGHRIPSEGPSTSWRFFLDHTYRQSPEAYAAGLPGSFPSYCQIF